MSWNPLRDAKTRTRWREMLMRAQSGLCGLCGHRIPEPDAVTSGAYAGFEPTFDHIVPRAHGGEDALHNLRLVHRCCNHIRGDSDGLKRLPTVPRPLKLGTAKGWEAYHRAADGTWVRADRECVRGDGLPKKQFETLEAAERCARSMSVPEGKRGRRYHAYVCSSGHIHIGALRD